MKALKDFLRGLFTSNLASVPAKKLTAAPKYESKFHNLFPRSNKPVILHYRGEDQDVKYRPSSR